MRQRSPQGEGLTKLLDACLIQVGGGIIQHHDLRLRHSLGGVICSVCFYDAVFSAREIVIPPSQSTDTAQAGSPTTASTLFPPPVMVPETTQLLMMKEDTTSLPSIISFPAPIRPPTKSVVSETMMVASSTVHPAIWSGAVGSYAPPNPTRPPTRRLFSPLTVITVPLTLQSAISVAP